MGTGEIVIAPEIGPPKFFLELFRVAIVRVVLRIQVHECVQIHSSEGFVGTFKSGHDFLYGLIVCLDFCRMCDRGRTDIWHEGLNAKTAALELDHEPHDYTDYTQCCPQAHISSLFGEGTQEVADTVARKEIPRPKTRECRLSSPCSIIIKVSMITEPQIENVGLRKQARP